ncbi:MAG: hypothetical protein ACLTTO_02725 [Lachnospiraceae bacterium]
MLKIREEEGYWYQREFHEVAARGILIGIASTAGIRSKIKLFIEKRGQNYLVSCNKDERVGSCIEEME